MDVSGDVRRGQLDPLPEDGREEWSRKPRARSGPTTRVENQGLCRDCEEEGEAGGGVVATGRGWDGEGQLETEREREREDERALCGRYREPNHGLPDQAGSCSGACGGPTRLKFDRYSWRQMQLHTFTPRESAAHRGRLAAGGHVHTLEG
jgi:hypothetical protein